MSSRKYSKFSLLSCLVFIGAWGFWGFIHLSHAFNLFRNSDTLIELTYVGFFLILLAIPVNIILFFLTVKDCRKKMLAGKNLAITSLILSILLPVIYLSNCMWGEDKEPIPPTISGYEGNQ